MCMYICIYIERDYIYMYSLTINTKTKRRIQNVHCNRPLGKYPFRISILEWANFSYNEMQITMLMQTLRPQIQT